MPEFFVNMNIYIRIKRYSQMYLLKNSAKEDKKQNYNKSLKIIKLQANQISVDCRNI